MTERFSTHVVVPVSRGWFVRRPWVLQSLPHVAVHLLVLTEKEGSAPAPSWKAGWLEEGLTLAWCFCVSPSEGEFRLPWEPAFMAPCLLCCRGAEQHTSERVCVSEDGGTSASSLTWVGIKGERGEWFRLPSCRCAWKLPAAAGLGEACSALDPWERLIRAQGGRR